MPSGTTFQTPQSESQRPRTSTQRGCAPPPGPPPRACPSSCAPSAASVSISASLRLVATSTSGSLSAPGQSAAALCCSGSPHSAAPHADAEAAADRLSFTLWYLDGEQPLQMRFVTHDEHSLWSWVHGLRAALPPRALDPP